jgi:hypothetical protein
MNNKLSRSSVSRRSLRLLATLTWYMGGFILLVKGGSLLSEAYVLRPEEKWPFYSTFLAIVIGVIKATYLFNKSCRKNLERIGRLSYPRIWQFFQPRFFLFLTLMVITGATLSRLAHGNYPWLIGVGIVDLSVGVALLVSSQLFWRMK